MARDSSVPAPWPTGPLDRRFGTVLDGGWAGLTAAVVGFVVFVTAHQGAQELHEVRVLALGLYLMLVGIALGPVFAWITHRLEVPLVPAGLVFALAFGLGAGLNDARDIVTLLVYGAGLGLSLRYIRARRAPGTLGGEQRPPLMS